MNNIGHDAKEMLEVLSEKQKLLQKKMNIKLDKDLNFSDVCNLITKEDMGAIGQHWSAGKGSKLKKNEFAEVIKENIVEKFNEVISKGDIKLLNTLIAIVKNNGIIENEKLDGVNDEALFYLRSLGILFVGKNEEGKPLMIIPKDILKTVDEFINNTDNTDKMKKNEDVLRVARGVIYYMGILEVESFAKYLSQLLNTEISEEFLSELVKENQKRSNDLQFIEKSEELMNLEFIASAKLTNPARMIAAQNSTELDYKGFTLKELSDAGIPNFAQWRKSHKNLFDHIRGNYQVSDVQAQLLVNAVIFGLKDGSSIEETLEVLNNCFQFDTKEERKEFEKLLIKVQAETELWSLRGHMPSEFKPQTVVKADKVGRNEPCPCGSGKKYKKCCGK